MVLLVFVRGYVCGRVTQDTNGQYVGYATTQEGCVRVCGREGGG